MSRPQRITVLHVDDDRQFGELTKTMLEREHDRFDVLTETDPHQVTGLLDECDIDCLVSDYEMPGVDGIELLEQTRKNGHTLPVILFTGKGTEEVASRAISAGVTEYLQKEGGADQFTVLANRILNTVEHRANERRRNQYQTIVETAGDAMYVLNESGDIEIVNDAFERMSGYDREELLGAHVSEFLSPDQVEKGAAAIQTLRRNDSRESERFTFHAERPGGETRRYETTVSLVERNGFAGSVGITRDITDERRAEKLLSGLFEKSLHGIGVKEIVTDESGEPVDYIYKRVNDRFEELTGLDAEEVVGNRATEVLDGIEQTPFIDIFGDVALNGTTAQFEQYSAPLDRYYEVSAFSPRRGECISIFSDITERKEREEELVQYKTYVEETSDTIAVVNPDGTIKFHNHSTGGNDGFSPFNVAGETGFEYVHPEDRDRIIDLFTTVVGDGAEEVTTELRVETADDGWRWIETRGVNRIDDPEIEGIIVSSRDITERKEREEELRRERDRLDEFASVISHDLRNPLNIATTRTELAREECDSDHLSDVTEALSRMEALIDDLLTLARQGKTVGDREQIPLEEIVAGCWRNIETGDATITAETQATLAADRSRLAQALENLFRNAIDHGDESVAVTVGVLSDETGIYVADDGPGIPEEDREDVFESSYTTSADGTGFGLAIVEQICAAHGWNITATESEAGGARFELSGIDSIDC